MSKIEYTRESVPTPDEFRRHLREAHEQYDPIETLLTFAARVDCPGDETRRYVR